MVRIFIDMLIVVIRMKMKMVLIFEVLIFLRCLVCVKDRLILIVVVSIII